jgi:hypothetical protein
VGAVRSDDEVPVRIGRAEWWFASDLFGPNWKPPQGDDTYLLVRLAYSLRPQEDNEVEEAHLEAKLSCPGAVCEPVAFELFPREVTEESKRDVKLKLEPSLKIKEVGASAGSVETTIHMDRVEPIVTAFGIGTSVAEWRFRKHKLHPLLGARTVYLILAYPSSAGRVQLALDLKANVRVSRFGSWLFTLSETAKAQATQTIP